MADLTGLTAAALTWVDNVGVTRVKAVPVARLDEVAAHGVGMSKVHDTFGVDDSITPGRLLGGPVGDLRLRPDLAAAQVFAAAPGWAWAPVDRHTQQGEPYRPDQRGIARRAVAAASAAGLTLRMGFELEWSVGEAALGPAYGFTRLMELADYGRDLLTALDRSGVPVLQYHPEYAPGQFELSTEPADPVGAADRLVLTRETVREVSRRHGIRASFSPVPVVDSTGNGCHLHFSVAREGEQLLRLPHPEGESILAGVLSRLPALTGLSAPGLLSKLRLSPQRWAGAYQCWGVENREAALRLIQGDSPNAELKCVDGAANPYLVVAAVAAIVTASVGAGLTLPPPVQQDPDLLATKPPRLPGTIADGLAALAADPVLADLLGPELLDAFTTVHTAEAERWADLPPEHVAEAVRWRY